jgi:hypothetical protein
MPASYLGSSFGPASTQIFLAEYAKKLAISLDKMVF